MVPSAVASAREDLHLHQRARTYPNKILRKAVAQKLGNHLWYLSEALIPTALFDPKVPVNEKQQIVAAMGVKEGNKESIKHIPPPAENSKLADLAMQAFMGFFNKI